jgi:hypothetical protein
MESKKYKIFAAILSFLNCVIAYTFLTSIDKNYALDAGSRTNAIIYITLGSLYAIAAVGWLVLFINQNQLLKRIFYIYSWIQIAVEAMAGIFVGYVMISGTIELSASGQTGWGIFFGFMGLFAIVFVAFLLLPPIAAVIINREKPAVQQLN